MGTPVYTPLQGEFNTEAPSQKRCSQPHAKNGRQDMSAIIWMDMEMSGLEPETDRILEVAVLVTDGELEVVAEGPNLVLHQPDAVLEAMDS